MKASVSTHRTQLYLPTDLYQWAKQRAKKEDTSFAEFVRRVLTQMAQAEKKTAAATYDLADLSGIITRPKGPTDVSQNLPKYLKQMYDEKFLQEE